MSVVTNILLSFAVGAGNLLWFGTLTQRNIWQQSKQLKARHSPPGPENPQYPGEESQ